LADVTHDRPRQRQSDGNAERHDGPPQGDGLSVELDLVVLMDLKVGVEHDKLRDGLGARQVPLT
jgi:hypothetical protein